MDFLQQLRLSSNTILSYLNLSNNLEIHPASRFYANRFLIDQGSCLTIQWDSAINGSTPERDVDPTMGDVLYRSPHRLVKAIDASGSANLYRIDLKHIYANAVDAQAAQYLVIQWKWRPRAASNEIAVTMKTSNLKTHTSDKKMLLSSHEPFTWDLRIVSLEGGVVFEESSTLSSTALAIKDASFDRSYEYFHCSSILLVNHPIDRVSLPIRGQIEIDATIRRAGLMQQYPYIEVMGLEISSIACNSAQGQGAVLASDGDLCLDKYRAVPSNPMINTCQYRELADYALLRSLRYSSHNNNARSCCFEADLKLQASASMSSTSQALDQRATQASTEAIGYEWLLSIQKLAGSIERIASGDCYCSQDDKLTAWKWIGIQVAVQNIDIGDIILLHARPVTRDVAVTASELHDYEIGCRAAALRTMDDDLVAAEDHPSLSAEGLQLGYPMPSIVILNDPSYQLA
jgi:hypothetical protein